MRLQEAEATFFTQSLVRGLKTSGVIKFLKKSISVQTVTMLHQVTAAALTGTLVALDTETGDEVWRLDMDYYAWSSPVAVYDDDGSAYVVVCDSAGNASFIDGITGTVLDTEYLGGLVEASPAVYENMLVVGTRIRQICGVKIK